MNELGQVNRRAGVIGASLLAGVMLLIACSESRNPTPPQPPQPSQPAPSANAEPIPHGPNIVFILADDLGAMDLGVTGSTYYDTPNIDRLAAEGVRFSDAYAAAPTCSPTRAAILTGRYPARLHFTAPGPGWVSQPHQKLRPPRGILYLRQSETTYAEAFRAAGYRTAHIGKWHVRGDPAEHGFDVVEPFTRDREPSDPWQVERYTRAAERFIDANRDRPFLLTVSHGTVHTPLYEKPENIAAYRDKPPGANGQQNPVMAAMIRTLDRSIGRIMDKLRATGLEESTVVVFTSDNGGLSSATSNRPLRGGKSQLYEGGIRVPLIVRWGGQARPGLVVTAPVISTDLFPTFLSIAGLPPRPEQHLDGIDLAALLRGSGTLQRRSLYFHYPHYHRKEPHSALRSDNWKLIRFHASERTVLYNLDNDIGERRDLAKTRPVVTATLQEMLDTHLESIGAEHTVANPDFDPVAAKQPKRYAKWNPHELSQHQDPRRYVTDPGRDYGTRWHIGAPSPEADHYSPETPANGTREKTNEL